MTKMIKSYSIKLIKDLNKNVYGFHYQIPMLILLWFDFVLIIQNKNDENILVLILFYLIQLLNIHSYMNNI